MKDHPYKARIDKMRAFVWMPPLAGGGLDLHISRVEAPV
jgi:hypothetical protein